jgi:hypothetical protein
MDFTNILKITLKFLNIIHHHHPFHLFDPLPLVALFQFLYLLILLLFPWEHSTAFQVSLQLLHMLETTLLALRIPLFPLPFNHP